MTLYLKYRPQDFDSLEGQEFIKNTLKEAIKKEKLVGAYLFCGPRGTGKTSSARIFAKAINCLNPKDGNPCLECEICKSFSEENLVDIIEIDAASYTGVDNVREIIERAKFMPTKCKYKVYIIDEVHMLSKGAFNALLKILEEPPAHLKFILATTEIHKIPETILSRCQRYDFKSITKDDIKKRLLFISENEKIKIDEKSLDYIVKESNGGLRNAISLFEQLIIGNEINFDSIIANYGIPDSEKLENFYAKLMQKDESILKDFDDIYLNFNLNLFFKELLFLIKDKLLENLNTDNFLNILYLLETLEEVYLKAKNSFDAKTTFLIGVVKCLKGKEFFEKSENISPKPQIKQENNFHKEFPKPNIQKNISQNEKIVISEKEIELSHEDIFDVFSHEDVLEEKVEPKTTKTQNTSSFPKDNLIDTLKKNGAKGGLTMSLRAADFIFDSKTLIIKSKTKIAFKQISDNDSISRINEVLENIGYPDIEVKVE